MLFAQKTSIGHLIPFILLTGLLLLAFLVLREFLVVIIWAFIISYVTWPIYAHLRRLLRNKRSLSALIMTSIITVLLLLLLSWLAIMLQAELKLAYQTLVNDMATRPYQLPNAIKQLPWLGAYLQQTLDNITNEAFSLPMQLADWFKQLLRDMASVLSGIGKNILRLGVILLTVFFCFRDGDNVVKQIQQGLLRFLGQHQHIYLQAAENTVRAVVYGLTLAAVGQGLCASIGYAIAGVKAPILFGLLTALLALVPMGAVLVWLPMTLLLAAMGQFWQAIGLGLWCFLVVSSIDNVIRPVVISGTGDVPFLVVLFGVFGGLSAFGVVGLFLGPVVLAVLLSVWQVWLQQ